MVPRNAVKTLFAHFLVLGLLLLGVEALVATPLVLFVVAVAGILLSPLAFARLSTFEAVVPSSGVRA
jgi:hypothetical protein